MTDKKPKNPAIALSNNLIDKIFCHGSYHVETPDAKRVLISQGLKLISENKHCHPALYKALVNAGFITGDKKPRLTLLGWYYLRDYPAPSAPNYGENHHLRDRPKNLPINGYI